jgi:hypothetical protein
MSFNPDGIAKSPFLDFQRSRDLFEQVNGMFLKRRHFGPGIPLQAG